MNPVTAVVAQAQSITRSFGNVVALKGVSFAVSAGEIVLLAGPNGAGKSTLLRVLAGLARPTRGAATVLGRPVRGDPAARGAVGFVSHQNFLYDHLTARENLRFAAALHGVAPIEQRVTEALDAAGLTQRADSRVGVLSHGTRQRLSIARATLHAPAMLLLDEPFSGLDAASGARLRDAITASAARGAAVICVTHQPADLWPIATRVMLLSRGAIVFDTPRPESLDAFLAQCEAAVAG